MPRLQEARDAGGDIHLVDGFHTANEIRPTADGLAFHAGDENSGGRGGGLLAGRGGLFLAARQQGQAEQQRDRKGKVSCLESETGSHAGAPFNH